MQTPNAQPTNVGAEAIEAIRKLSAAALTAQVITVKVSDGESTVEVPVAMLPTGTGKLEPISLLEQMGEAAEFAKSQRLMAADGPDFRSGIANHQALSSFIEHAKRFKADNSALWANPSTRALVSILDYHPAGHASEPRWMRHRGAYTFPLSEAFVAWGGISGKAFTQEDFAKLLDSRDMELATGVLPSNDKKAPEPASLVTLAQNLEVYAKSTAKRERDPNTGRVKVSYTEDKGVSGDVLPPPAFLINIPIFQDSDAELLEVRLRVEVVEGHAKFLVQIHRAADLLRFAFQKLSNLAAEQTGMPLFIGVQET